MRSSLSSLLLLLVAGCAASPDAQTAEAPATVCVREYPIGSNIPVTRCQAPQADAERQRTAEDMRDAQRLPGTLSTKGAGS